ncbi:MULTISPECIES: substrate-binding domain-containing protein [unclassified Rhizobium]|uniref:substrate-binding domain-containing protein n=1 Tax=unclassified Rhizobium TaxID=2613769 RepID=UPI0006F2D2A5|nr:MULTISPECIES: substrate-binding domain-containing protein [unclassified Rhizobium]KQV44106.1 LacI family transcriptional regulator [Rhizobium sp. Root1212]KRD38287.1 LacI family transcriptional regulator [Rhizobium sp. Root268]
MTDKTKKKATIYDLSVISGISPSTVSAVLNGTWRKRRIKEATAELIQKLAEEHGYSANLQARGLRSSRSGLVGLLLPVHDNRYFSSMAQYFEAQVRSTGQCPIVVSACRDPDEEHQIVESLISYSIDELLIAGATDPDGVHDICERAGLKHVNIDLPGSKAPSVVTDNYEGGRLLTQALIERMREQGPVAPDELHLFGGRDDHASRERIRAFRDVKRAMLGGDPDSCIQPTGYSPGNTAHAFEAFHARHGRLPRGFFVNSSINLEGLMRFLAQHPQEAFADIVVGCFDYDPFASFLPFPLFMIRQDAEAMITKGLSILSTTRPPIMTHLVAPTLVPPRTALIGPLDALKDPDAVHSVL